MPLLLASGSEPTDLVGDFTPRLRMRIAGLSNRSVVKKILKSVLCPQYRASKNI